MNINGVILHSDRRTSSEHVPLPFSLFTSTLSIMKCRPRLPPTESTSYQVLWERWELLPTRELAVYLRRIIVAERRCRTGEFSRRLFSRFRRRRIAVGRRLIALGGTVHPRLFIDPHIRGWKYGQQFWLANVSPKLCRPAIFLLVPIVTGIQ